MTIEAYASNGEVMMVKFSVSNGLYGKRSPFHVDCYQPMPGWLLIALGSWTLEVCWVATQPRLARARVRQRA
ncbi:MAG TPA: hypothetical protein VJO99_09225 [Burkholderiaceae bacterium]|nr:hypothetical protein [Burkholderiaceae bacterium]